jgi:hypothetical protein
MNRRVRLGILCAPAFSYILAAAPAGAQVDIPPEAQGFHKACVGDGSNDRNAIQTVDHTIYTCQGSAAQNYFDYLVSKNALQTIDKQRTGTYIFRAIPQVGRCWEKTENIDGVATSTFGCSINIAKQAK